MLPCRYSVNWLSNCFCKNGSHTLCINPYVCVYRDETEPTAGPAPPGSRPPMKSVLRRDDDYPMCWQQVALVAGEKFPDVSSVHWVTSSHPTNTVQICCWATDPGAVTDWVRRRKETFRAHLCRCSKYLDSCRLFTVHFTFVGSGAESASGCFAERAFYTTWISRDGHLWLCDWIWQPSSAAQLFLLTVMIEHRWKKPFVVGRSSLSVYSAAVYNWIWLRGVKRIWEVIIVAGKGLK